MHESEASVFFLFFFAQWDSVTSLLHCCKDIYTETHSLKAVMNHLFMKRL